ncbi:MAG: hypothetical protein ABIG66_00095 [Candidatus Kerfeldbacteria bacterium]
MKIQNTNSFLPFSKRFFLLSIIAVFTAFFAVCAHPASAAWNQPTCNPDVVGPDHPTCNIAAPLNVSSAGQTKEGELTIQNTLRAGELQINSGLGGDGTVQVVTAKGIAISVTQNDPLSRAVDITTSSTKAGLRVTQNGTGPGIAINTSANNALGLNVSATAGNTPTGIKVDATGASNAVGMSIAVDNNGTGVLVTNSNVGIQTIGTAMGIEAISTTGPAARLHAAVGGEAVIVENTGTGRALDAMAGGVSPGSIVTHSSIAGLGKEGVRATTDSSYGVIGYTTGSTLGAGVLGQAVDDYGVIGWSTNYYGVYGNTEDPTTYYGGIFCNQRTNCASLGGPVYAGLFDGRVFIYDRTEIDGDSADPMLIVDNSNASGEGLRVRTQTASLTPAAVPENTAIEAQSYSGYGVYAYSETKTALHAEGATGAEFYSSGGTGMEVTVPGGGTGVSINTDPYDYGLITNGSIIKNEGAFEGGQFYPYQNSSSGIHHNVDTRVLDDIDLSPELLRDIAFDGSDIWVTSYFDKTIRINAVDGRVVHTYSHAAVLNPKRLLLVETPANGPRMYVFGENGNYEYIPLYDSTIGSGNLGFAERIESVAWDGDSIWMTTSLKNVYDWDMVSPPVLVTTTTGLSYAIEYANGKIYVTDANASAIIKITPTDHTVSTINNVPRPIDIAFDGQYLWTVDYSLEQLNRTHVIREVTTSYDISALGDNARRIEFDGSKIWIAYYNTDGIASFDIAKKELDSQLILTGDAPKDMVFDGTNMWVSNYSGYNVTKVGTGAGTGQGATPMTKGFYFWGQDGSLYCVYIDGTGTLNQSTTLSNCR